MHSRPLSSFLLGCITSLACTLVAFYLAFDPTFSYDVSTNGGDGADVLSPLPTCQREPLQPNLRDFAIQAPVHVPKKDSPWRQKLKDELEAMDLQFGEHFFERSVSYAGTNHRLKQKLRRAMKGEVLSIGIIGGSVTSGHGMPWSGPQLRWGRYFEEVVWNGTLFPHPDFVLSDTGLPGAGSGYFEYCALEHLPAAPDIIILDNAVNDYKEAWDFSSYDRLLRILLDLESQPAIIQLELMALEDTICVGCQGGSNQLDVARYFDVTSLSTRNPFLPALLAYPERIPLFYGRVWEHVDPRHFGLRGHYAAAMIVKHYMTSLLLKLDDEDSVERSKRIAHMRSTRIPSLQRQPIDETKTLSERLLFMMRAPVTVEDERAWGDDLTSHYDELVYTLEPDDPAGSVPRLMLQDNWDNPRMPVRAHPRCDALLETRHRLEALSITPGREVVDGVETGQEGQGWYEWSSREDKRYFRSNSTGAVISFKLPQLGRGDVRINFLRSKTFGLGTVKCWVDDKVDEAVVIDGWWEFGSNVGVTLPVASGLTPTDDHILHVELLTKEFRIITVITT